MATKGFVLGIRRCCRRGLGRLAGVGLTLGLLAPLALAVEVTTNKYDNTGTGANLAETTLTTSNVNVNTFGKKFSVAVDSEIYAQPLVVTGLSIAGGTHDVVYVATMNNSVYAFDANAAGAALWSRLNLKVPVPQGDVQCCCTDADVPFGICGTPVIDRSTNTMYFVARQKDAAALYHQFLYAVDIATGADKFGGPVEITATYTVGTTTVTFDPKIHNQRPGLILTNGQVLIGWASHNDCATYHGWLISYSASNLQKLWTWVDTPTGSQGGIWGSGQGPSIDAAGNIFVTTGNGTIAQSSGNYSMSLVKLSSSGAVLDWWTHPSATSWNRRDLDLGSAGVLLLPGTNLAVLGGKEGHLFTLNQNSFGHKVSPIQDWTHAGGNIHCQAVYCNVPAGQGVMSGPTIYVWPQSTYMQAYKFNTGTQLFTTTPATITSATVPNGHPGGMLAVSANASTPGTAIVWACHPLVGDANHQTRPGILRAYDASDLTKEIYDSYQNQARDDFGNFAKFNLPTVANGKVYVPTFSNQLVVYGLLP
jgi:hypothetical protein